MCRRDYVVLCFLLLGLLVATSPAQVVRESAAGSVAGVLVKADGYLNEYVIEVDGHQLLVADLDAALFMRQGGSGCGDDTGGCTGETSGSTGCEGESGAEDEPFGFFIEVWQDGTLICSAGRPTAPGWERDPRLACILEDEGHYVLKIRHVPRGENAPALIPYLLSVSLRRIAPSGSDLKEALWISRNELEVMPIKD